MKYYSFFTNAFKHFSLEYALDHLSSLNLRAVELWCKGQHVTPYDCEEQVRRVREMIASRSMEVSALSAHLDYITSNRELREENIRKFERVISLARLFDVRLVVTASGYLHGKPPSREMERRFLDALERLAGHAEDSRVTIALEPEPEKFLRTPEQAVSYIQAVGSDAVKTVCDLSHAIALNMTPMEFISKMQEYLVHVHVDDARYGEHPHRHLIPGEGDVNYRELFRYLEDIGYEGWLSLELNQHTQYPRQAAEEAMRFLEGVLR
jgi:sugar phosphate isomerase/epimerase